MTTRKHVAIQHRAFVPGPEGSNATLATDTSTSRFQSLGPLGEDGLKDWTVGIGLPNEDGTPSVYEFGTDKLGNEHILIVDGSCEINGKMYDEGQRLFVESPNKVRMVFSETCAYFCRFER